MKHNYEYEFGRILLKPLCRENIECLRELRNQNRHYFITQQEISKEDQEKWYQSYLEKENDIMFQIVQKETPEEFIGAIALYDIDQKKKTAEFGRVVIDKEKAPGKGIGTEAVKAVCLVGFEILQLEKIVCDVLKTNIRAIKAYRHAGFEIVKEDGDLCDMEITPDMLHSHV